MYGKLMAALVCLLLTVCGLSANQAVAQTITTNSTPIISLSTSISQQQANFVLRETQLAWDAQYGFTYSDLRTAYNHGQLTIILTIKPDGFYYDVIFGGLTICIIDPTT